MTVHYDLDFLLQMIVDSVERRNNKIPVTLLIDGILVSGDLVSGINYYKMLSEMFPFIEDQKEEDQCLLESHIFDGNLDYGYVAPIIHDRVTFFHLINSTVKVSAGGDKPKGNLKMFRGRLEKVSGFYLD